MELTAILYVLCKGCSKVNLQNTIKDTHNKDPSPKHTMCTSVLSVNNVCLLLE